MSARTVLLCLCATFLLAAPDRVLSRGWAIQSSVKVSSPGATLSQPGFDVGQWYATEVPSTVMGALTRLEVHKEPLFGRNLEAISPEPFKTSWWFRTEFDEAPAKDAHTRLCFDGINYRADIWLNGQKVAGADQVFGAFRTFDLDITPFLKAGKNALAVEVHPPKPGDFTMGFVDWNPLPPDRNMGLFREVRLRRSGAVSLDDTFVRSAIDLKTLASAALQIETRLVNHEDRPVSGSLHGTIGSIQFQVPYHLAAKEQKTLHLGPHEVPGLKIQKPRLWWPHTLGKPELYTLDLKALEKGQPLDEKRVTFGIRQVSDYLTPEGHRGYIINGRKLLILGGGWVDDLFLREDPKNLEAQFQYVKQLNLNTVRLEGFWGSSQRLYDLADREGVLLMVGWSCQWEWPEYMGSAIVENETFGGPKAPKDVDLVTACLRDQVRWLRNHPSLFVWVVGSDKLPWPEVEARYIADLKTLDPSRPLLTSCKSLTSPVSGPSAVKMAGPYDYVTPNYWWEDTKNGGAYGFNTETGPGPQIPPMSSLKRMLPPEKLWPINEDWNYHCGRFQFGSLDTYLKAFKARYGESASAEEFAFKAQAANYEAMRAMYEAFAVNRPRTTGLIQWMLNAAWPKFYWQLYDHFLMPNGAFYGARKGAQPVAAVFHPVERAVYVVNDSMKNLEGARLRVRLYDQNSTLVFDREVAADEPAGSGHKALTLPPAPETPVSFLDLRLTGANGQELATNFYWLSAKPDVLDEAGTNWYLTPNKSFADFTSLSKLPPTEIRLEMSPRKGQDWEAEVTLTNTSNHIAFFLELGLVDAKGESLVPVLWDDNDLSLLPGEKRKIHVRLPGVDLRGTEPRLTLRGWNTPPKS
ncbi:sugar-binding domain-containing protein [Geothrix sp. PMB-07]|uniref:glycosyl hydrolase 2 galactose-binding domain-containing protein n=1 Tax=Geothrix sp. PMB-07 TaxID=3068640 RepID=UPI0027418281|nr:sugar-binding domain-containing protein [Geothrix sp. PMB-07]WLT33466.1 glycoside hydrolase family 2 TIM barrel-domain containing protein [Geothrix sp. PMB-07]